MTLLKTCTFAMVHFSIAFSVVYLLTGSAFIGGTVALIEPACNTVAFFLHEKLWNRLNLKTSGQPLAGWRPPQHHHA